ncbi:unnamed protein product [Haemonchus placei]|uniref:Ovule protein n=1 Tax=Haemonchus placei TaxID=6290 RepID=A0A0N4VUH6_HAEPC|nr:unnamed protein product [Haemonchus placei]
MVLLHFYHELNWNIMNSSILQFSIALERMIELSTASQTVWKFSEVYIPQENSIAVSYYIVDALPISDFSLKCITHLYRIGLTLHQLDRYSCI